MDDNENHVEDDNGRRVCFTYEIKPERMIIELTDQLSGEVHTQEETFEKVNIEAWMNDPPMVFVFQPDKSELDNSDTEATLMLTFDQVEALWEKLGTIILKKRDFDGHKSN